LRQLAVALLTGVVLFAVIVIIWTLPPHQVPSQGLTVKERIELRNASRATLAQIVGGAFFVVTASLTWWNARITQDGQITGRFNNAVTHLGDKESLSKRVGAIYALERIARDSERDHWPIMEILTSFILDTAYVGPPWVEIPAIERLVIGPQRVDIQAAMTVLARRKWEREKPGQFLYLQAADLRGVMVPHARLKGAYLWAAHLEGTRLTGAHLEGAVLANAYLENADLEGAHLQGALLQEARLQGANLVGTNLQGADLAGAQLLGARYSARTRWPDGFDPQALGTILADPED
jgi:hypothetical protein